MKNWILRCLLMAVILTFCLPMGISADPIEAPETASLTLEYSHDGVAYQDLEIKTFRVADITGDALYALSGQFAQYPIDLKGINYQSEWDAIVQTLEAYIWADGLTPTATATTDQNGIVKFENLTPGMYLTMTATHLGETATTEFFGFLTVIPHPEADGSLNYDVTAHPKASQHAPADGDSVALNVVKQWKDSGYEQKRPPFIKVDIYRNGVYKTTVKLSADNNWYYGWVADADGAVWTAVEREIPSQYTVSVEQKGSSIILTNVYEASDDPPKSGDSTLLWPYMLLMCLSGCGLILLSLGRKKNI